MATEYSVGQAVVVRYQDHVEAGKPAAECPLVEGRILSRPMGDSPYFEIEVSDEAIRATGGWVDEEAEGLPYLAAEADIIGVLPDTWEEGDVEAWLANER